MLFREVSADEIHLLREIWTKINLNDAYTQSVPRSKHTPSWLYKAVTMYWEIITLEVHTKHIYTLHGQNVQFFFKRLAWWLTKRPRGLRSRVTARET
jgi:hypothetical protein